jgi:hypothetical protein
MLVRRRGEEIRESGARGKPGSEKKFNNHNSGNWNTITCLTTGVRGKKENKFSRGHGRPEVAEEVLARERGQKHRTELIPRDQLSTQTRARRIDLSRDLDKVLHTSPEASDPEELDDHRFPVRTAVYNHLAAFGRHSYPESLQ